MKQENAILKISELTALDIAVSSDEGDKINNRIIILLQNYERVVLDFSGIKLLTTAFLNAAIGQLYNTYSSDEIAKRIQLRNVTEDDLPLFKKVIDRAKEYFKDKEKFSETTDNVLDGKPY